MSIKAVIFDVGGVLMRTENREPRATLGLRFGKTYEEMDKIIFGKSGYHASLGEVTAHEHWQSVMRVLDLPDSEIDDIYTQFFGGDEVDYALIDYIRSLRPRYTTAILSNAWDDLRQILVEKWQIDDAFDEIFISAEMGIAKPDPKIYKMVIEKLGIAPEEMVFVDDLSRNIEAARKLGMHAIHFQKRDEVIAELQKLLGK